MWRSGSPNRQEASVSFSGATVSRCDTTGLIENWGIRKSSDRATITSNGTVYSLTEQNPGTPFLIASASNEVGRMWTKELPVVQASDGFSMVSTPQMLVAWGRTTSTTTRSE